MKYTFSALLVFLFLSKGLTQNIKFDLAIPQPLLQEVYEGSILSGDLDNDGDIDLVQSGLGENLTGQIAEPSVFLNDGNGNFILEEQNFMNYFTTEKMVLGDLDGDGNLDLIISSINRSDLYINNGQAQFVLADNIPFQPSDGGELIIGDIDGDGDNDVIQFGQLNSSNPFALLFINDGSGGFIQAQNQSLTPFLLAKIEFVDIEGDGDLDLLSFGKDDNNAAQVAVYENDGLGNFSVFSDSNIGPHAAEEISIGDIDNDGDQDVLITGLSSASIPKTILYTNNGNGDFSEVMNTNFPDIFAGGSAFADLDNDNDLDILLIGSMAGGIPNIFSIVFENLGNNSFIAADSLGGEYIASYTVADLNGDEKKDIIIQGFVDDTNIYWNVSAITNVIEKTHVSTSLFPNPNNGQFQLEWIEGVFSNCEVIDPFGKVIYSKSISEHENSINLDINIPSGLYFLRLSGKKYDAIHRFILMK